MNRELGPGWGGKGERSRCERYRHRFPRLQRLPDLLQGLLRGRVPLGRGDEAARGRLSGRLRAVQPLRAQLPDRRHHRDRRLGQALPVGARARHRGTRHERSRRCWATSARRTSSSWAAASPDWPRPSPPRRSPRTTRVLVVDKNFSGWAGQANKGAGIFMFLGPDDPVERFLRLSHPQHRDVPRRPGASRRVRGRITGHHREARFLVPTPSAATPTAVWPPTLSSPACPGGSPPRNSIRR